MCLGVIPSRARHCVSCLRKGRAMNTVRDECTTIVGVDTHAQIHTYILLEAASGRAADTVTFPRSTPKPARLDRSTQETGKNHGGHRRHQLLRCPMP